MSVSNHKFKTSKENKKGNVLRFICAFLAFAIVFGSISAIVIMKHNEISLKDIFSKETTTVSDNKSSTNTTTVINRQISGSANILLYCTDTEQKELYFLIIVRADMDNKTFKVYPLNTDVNVDGKTYIELLAQGGYKSLVAAVEKSEGVTIDRYISSNTNTFALAINYMGGLEYNILSRIEYRNNDYTLILTQGSQTIKGETLLKYFRYCKTLGTDGLKTQGNLICAMIDGYITPENVEKGITIYQKVLSKINSASDVSYIEAAQAISTLKILCNSGERKPATVVMNYKSDN
jgi:anionic cell wall polymer biosynthesis LytR-Cps2A-Psr (LCP) family protein